MTQSLQKILEWMYSAVAVLSQIWCWEQGGPDDIFEFQNFEWGRWNSTVNTIDSTGLAWVCVPLILNGAGSFK